MSILLAIVVNRQLPGINFFRALYYIPVISGSIAVGIAWRLIWNTNGLLNSPLISLGLLGEPVQWLAEPKYTLAIAMLLTIWLGLGYYMMIFLAGLQNIPEELYDAAELTAATAGRNTGTSACRACGRRSRLWPSSPAWRRWKCSTKSMCSPAGWAASWTAASRWSSTCGGRPSGCNHAGYASAVAIVLLVITLAFSVLNIRYLERGTEAD